MITGAQIRMARGYLQWSVKDLAERAGVAVSTVKRMEMDEGAPVTRGDLLEAVYRVLVAEGIVFLSGNGHGPGVALSKYPEAPDGKKAGSRGQRRRDNGDDFGAVAFAPA